MPPSPNKNDPKKEDWWDESSEKEIQNKWKDAMEDYFIYHDTKAQELRMSVDFVKELLPWVAMKDRRWKKFPIDSFTTNKYEAHTELYQVIRFKLDAMKKEEQKAKADADAKARAEEAREQAEMKRLVEEKRAEQAKKNLKKNQTQIISRSADSKSVGSASRKRQS